MHVLSTTSEGTDFQLDSGEHYHSPHGEWLYAEDDQTHLIYAGERAELSGAVIPLAGDANAQAVHVAYRQAYGETDLDAIRAAVQATGAEWRLDADGKLPVPLIIPPPSPEEVAERTSEYRRMIEEAQIRSDNGEPYRFPEPSFHIVRVDASTLPIEVRTAGARPGAPPIVLAPGEAGYLEAHARAAREGER